MIKKRMKQTPAILFFLSMILSVMLVFPSSLLEVKASIPNPIVSPGIESIDVSNCTPGATLDLCLVVGGSIVDTVSNIPGATHTFSNVAPNSIQYYVTQTLGADVSYSSFVNSILRTPVATPGIGYVDVSNVYPGATITLYTSIGGIVSSSPTLNGDGTYRFSGLTAGDVHYVVQSINGVVSTGSDTVTVQAPPTPSEPTVAAGLESIEVSNFTPGANLKLYYTSGVEVATATNVTGTIYTFSNVEPNSIQYYVTQTVSGVESLNSSFVNSTLRTPVATAGIGYVDVSNVYPGATITLYNSVGGTVSTSPTANGDGTYRFSGLTAGNQHYVGQSINSVVSTGSSLVTVLAPATPSAPTVTSRQESIEVSNFTSGANLKLYLTTGGSALATATNVTSSTYTFSNVAPNNIQYYVTQTVSGVESLNSTFVNSTIRTPVATAGIGYVDVSNVYPGATITLYTSTGGTVSQSPTANGDGTYRFSGLMHGNTHYVTQSINGVVSSGSSVVTVVSPDSPSAPVVTAKQEGIEVSNFTSGANLKLYLTTGGAPLATATNVTDETYTFTNVEPNSTQYYVTQTVGGLESVNSSFVNSILRTPVATAGIGYVEVSNVYPGATITLYTIEGVSLSSSPSANGDGIYRFNGLVAGNKHYVIQSMNGVVSNGSNTVTVLATPTTPTSPSSDYIITAGANSTYKSNSEGTLTITCSGALSELTGIYIDGNLVDPSNYTLRSGSTILILHEDYLNSLSKGDHTVKFQYGVEFAETTFTIKVASTSDTSTTDSGSTDNNSTDTTSIKDDVPKTGESSLITWLFVVTILSGSAWIYLGKKCKLL